MRNPLSSYTDGSFVPLDTTSSTLVHREDAGPATKYLRVVGFNRGRRSRDVSFLLNDEEALYASVQPSGSAQLLVPDLPVYNSGVEVYASLRQPVSAWGLPEDLSSLIVLEGGAVIGVIIANVTASVDAQPILVHVQDSRRPATDIDPGKGSEAIVELYQRNGSVAVDIIQRGHSLAGGDIQARVHSGVFIYGDIFSE